MKIYKTFPLAILFPIICYSHMDPPGEIYPKVVVADELIYILFEAYQTMTSEEDNLEGGIFKKIYTSEGKSLGDRVRIQEDEFNGYFEMPEIVLPEELQGKYKKFNNSFYIFPDWRRKHKGTPFYLIADDKEYIKKTLDWGVHSIDIVEGFIVTQNSMVVLATVIKNNDVETLFPKTDLWMFHFNKFDGKIIFSKKIGDPTFIYSFPGTSNVIEKNQKVFFVWNKQAQMNHEEISLHLVQYDIASKSFSDTLLPYKSTWNISISIGATLRHICLAYHGISPEISVEFLPINTE